jgi:DNA primase
MLSENIETILEEQQTFRTVIVPYTRQAIRQLITETDQEFQAKARIEYCKDCMADLIIEVWGLMNRYEENFKRARVIERLLIGEKLQELVKEIIKLQDETIFLKHPEKGKNSITPEMIERAKEYPFTELIKFNNNQTLCPFHDDKDPSMHFYTDSNTVYCFSCNKSWDTIGFIIERDGLSFMETVRRLN